MGEFVDYLHEVFAPLGPITAKRMFGGHGIYFDRVMIGLVAANQLYLKVDDVTRAEFESVGSTPFIYVKNGKPMQMSYYLAPAAMYDDSDEARAWATRALEAAVRNRKPGRARRRLS